MTTPNASDAPRRIALAYSGGLDTTVMVPWLREQYDCEIVAVVGDVGQDAGDLADVRRRALASGATSCHVVDLKRRLLEEVIFPSLVAGAMYEGRYLLGTALARPVIAEAQVQVALAEGCDAVCHGCTGKGNDQVRFESAFAALAPHLRILAPWRTWSFRSRHDLLAYLAERGVETTASAEKIYSRDDNLWHISHEGGPLEDPWNAPPDDVWTRTVDPRDAPDEPADVMLSFESGRPVAVNGERLDPETLVARLDALAGSHGVGRLDMVENRLVGMKSRGCYETPAGTVLHAAIEGLVELCLPRDVAGLRRDLAERLADLVYEGRWFTPMRRTLVASVKEIARPLSGEVEVRLFKGGAMVRRRHSPYTLFQSNLAAFDMDETYDQSHAEGFIRLFSLPARVAAAVEARSPEETPSPGDPEHAFPGKE